MNDFNRLGGLKPPKAKPKPVDNEDMKALDLAAEKRGFVDRSARRKPGRKPSKRTFQLHPKVLPEIGEAFADEAVRLDMTQGQLLEILWKKYAEEG